MQKEQINLGHIPGKKKEHLKMKRHKHVCLKCHKSWICERDKMDEETLLLCAHKSSKYSLCDDCFKQFYDPGNSRELDKLLSKGRPQGHNLKFIPFNSF